MFERSPYRHALPALVLFAVTPIVGCSPAVEPSSAPLAGDAATSSALVPPCDERGVPWTRHEASSRGRFPVESLDIDLVDETRDTPAHGTFEGARGRVLPTTVWYPRVRASHRGFPIVMYSHGFASSRQENPDLARHLASHGFVVVAPTFPVSSLLARGGPSPEDAPNQPGDVRFVLDRVLALGTTPRHALEGKLDASRIAAVGFSLGGLTTLIVTFHPTLRDERIDVAVALAPPAGLFTRRFYEAAHVPVLVMHGAIDAIIPYAPHAATFRAEAVGPAALVSLPTGTHVGFSAQAKAIGLLWSNVDDAGCIAIEAALGDDAGDFSGFVTPLGGAPNGVHAPATRGVVCADELPDAMSPWRQLEITNQAVLSFLSARLASDPGSRGRACGFFLRRLAIGDDVVLESL